MMTTQVTTQKAEVDAAVYKTLLESTKAIPWKIDWSTMTFAYIGPQIEALLGWSPSSWRTVQDWVDRMHPDDRQWVVDYCVSQSKAGIDHEADYRALTTSGSYVWLRDVVHVVRRPDGTVEALVGFMFDISERKQTEEQLLSLQRELEELSFKDGLTGLANRRRFDALIDSEWVAARHTQRPLSLLMIDIDFFKQYNDHYGHVPGDDCLKRVAKTLGARVTRPRDFLARYGGEEFVLVLPDTDEKGAERVAARCREALFEERIPHETSAVAPTVTISVGVGTIIPSADDNALQFIDEVDKRLYQAKQRGRNVVVSGTSTRA
ncbi:MAG TPA: sensor domain-containing diguanylate cyclase [Labilithrix sp.]|jgi:diguanylate cyclase (GGDEF)-like protein/PAS domain S-box-containing protein|nr:sensor domain-containing diguanylate cyclase [Labilithrix sp.]